MLTGWIAVSAGCCGGGRSIGRAVALAAWLAAGLGLEGTCCHSRWRRRRR